MNAVCDVCLAKNANFNTARNKDLPFNTFYIVGKGSFVLYVEGASSVPNHQDEFLLKIFVFTIGLRMEFFTCHKPEMVSDRHQLIEYSFQ